MRIVSKPVELKQEFSTLEDGDVFRLMVETGDVYMRLAVEVRVDVGSAGSWTANVIDLVDGRLDRVAPNALVVLVQGAFVEGE